MENKRLIDANALNWGRCPADGKLVKAWLDEAPTVDAVEVVHGRWELESETEVSKKVYCTNCCQSFVFRKVAELQVDVMPYCPNCGAKMDGDGNG